MAQGTISAENAGEKTRLVGKAQFDGKRTNLPESAWLAKPGVRRSYVNAKVPLG
jgi:hypothetical protein